MQRKIIGVRLVLSCMLAACTMMAGCASTSIKPPTALPCPENSFENDFIQVVPLVDATNATLQDLISPDPAEVEQALNNFEANTEKMELLEKQLDKCTKNMCAVEKDYFALWEAKGNSRIHSQKRPASSNSCDVFDQIRQTSIGVTSHLHSYLAVIIKIRKYLYTDLTPIGVVTVVKAIHAGEDLKRSVKPVLSAIKRAKTVMAQRDPSTPTTADTYR